MDNYKSIVINNVAYSGESLELRCNDVINNPEIQNWEKDIYSFILEWISTSKTIVAATSGSTGPPKKILLQKKYMIASAMATNKALELYKDDTAWLCLPVHYIAGKMMIIRAILGGLNLVITEPNNYPTIDISTDFVAMVPNQVAKLLESEQGIEVLKKSKKILIGGASIPQSLENKIRSNNSIQAWHSYGMTETITHIALRKIGESPYKGSFKPLDGVSVSLNEENQLIISYPAIGVVSMVTNDIAQLYGDGTFSILGRKDDIIISGGIKLYPEKIENEIRKYIKAELFVAGLPDNILGQKLTLFIEGNDNKLELNDIKETIGNSLSKYQIPKEVVYLNKFIRTKTGKIMRDANIAIIDL